VSESSDSGQTSIVFMGRESFRMQVIDAEAIPGRRWDAPTERIIDRRVRAERRRGISADRRRDRRVEPDELSPVPASPWRRVIAISVATFACGVLVTMVVDRLSRRARAEMIAQNDRARSLTPAAPRPALSRPALSQLAPAQPAAPAPAPRPALIIEPIAKPIAEPALRPAPETTAALRPRRKAPAPPRAIRAAAPAAAATPAARPAGPRKWVDPFAE